MKFDYKEFKQIFTAALNFTSKNNLRPSLQYVQITVADGKLTVRALDGYRAIRITRGAAPTEEDFIVYMGAEHFFSGKLSEVVLNQNEIIYYNRFGSVSATVPLKKDVLPDSFKAIDSLMSSHKNGKDKGTSQITLNASFIQDVCKSLPKNNPIKFYIPEICTGSLICVSKVEIALFEFLVLPMRLTRDDL